MMFKKKPSEAQLRANRENAQHSHGAVTEEGKNHSKMNNFRHGLAGLTMVHVLLDWESEANYAAMEQALFDEHKPEGPTEKLLVGKMAQHYWLSQRAITIQSMAFLGTGPFAGGAEHKVGTYIRYQAEHDRAFYKALQMLLKLRAEKRKEKIGFESEKRREADETRKEAREIRQVERHKYFVAGAEMKLSRQNGAHKQAPLPQNPAPEPPREVQTDKIAA